VWRCISGVDRFGGIDIACKGLVTLSQVLIGPAIVEFVGDRLDGQLSWAALRLDVLKLASVFSNVECFRWYSGDIEGPFARGGLELFGMYYETATKIFFFVRADRSGL
jgi:hypothetical protein